MLQLLHTYFPQKSLQSQIAMYHLSYLGLDHGQSDTFMLPEGIIEIVFQLEAEVLQNASYTHSWERRPQAFVGGLHNRAYRMKAKKAGKMFSVRFYPGAFAAFAPIPLQHLKNQMVSLELIWGKSGRDLETQVLECPNDAGRIQILEDFLLKKRAGLPYASILGAVAAIEQDQPFTSIQDLARQFGYSLSRFRQLFNEVIGISPKEYLIVRRMNKALRYQSQTDTLTQLSYELGYHDQSHFIRECKKMTGLSPGKFLEDPRVFRLPG
ncbi:MAG: helix-turn-helix transcriptional regulator [Bacteroidota bacterium]